MSTINCWLNTSATKPVIWLKPAGSGPVTGNIFVNGLSPADRDVIVALLRECFGRVSVTMALPIEGISASKTGALGTTVLTAGDIIDAIESALDKPAPVADPEVAERASAIGRRLAGLPARPARPASAPAEKIDDEGITFE